MTKDQRLNWRHLVFKVLNYVIITLWTVINIATLCPEASNGGPFRYFRHELLYDIQCPMSPPTSFADAMVYTSVQMIFDLIVYLHYNSLVAHQKQTIFHHVVLLLNLINGAIAGYGQITGINLGLMAECTSLFIFWEHILPPNYKNGLIVRANLWIAAVAWVPFRLMCFPFLVKMGLTYDIPMSNRMRNNTGDICAYLSLAMLVIMSFLNYYWGYLLILKILRKQNSLNNSDELKIKVTDIEISVKNPESVGSSNVD